MVTFTGTYEDEFGPEALLWQIERTQDESVPGFVIRTTIRGVPLHGPAFDELNLSSPTPVGSDHHLQFYDDDLVACVLTGDLPCRMIVRGEEATGPVHFRLDLRTGDEVRSPDEFLVLSAVVEGRRHDVEMIDFENLRDLEDELPATQLKCCGTCRFVSYGLGNPLFGLRCHRDDREGFALAAQHPVTRWMARPTELVPDTHLCGQYERGDYVGDRVRPKPG